MVVVIRDKSATKQSPLVRARARFFFFVLLISHDVSYARKINKTNEKIGVQEAVGYIIHILTYMIRIRAHRVFFKRFVYTPGHCARARIQRVHTVIIWWFSCTAKSAPPPPPRYNNCRRWWRRRATGNRVLRRGGTGFVLYKAARRPVSASVQSGRSVHRQHHTAAVPPSSHTRTPRHTESCRGQ